MDYQKIDQFKAFLFFLKLPWYSISHSLIGNIHHNFLVPRMIESDPKTFMPIQTPDLHRVIRVMETKIFKTHAISNIVD